MSDLTPEGDPIDTRTIWLDFPEGQVALTLDLTAFNAAMRRCSESASRLGRRPSDG